MKKLVLLMVCLIVNSCVDIDKDKDQIFSYNDPYYLGINDLLANCNQKSSISLDQWSDSYDELLRNYRLNDFKIDYKGIALSGKTCQLIKSLEKMELKSFTDFNGENSTAMLVNLYNVLILDLVSSNLNKTLEIGKPDLPENRSPLNIHNKGLAIFREMKWPLFNRFMSLDQLEELISRDQNYISGIILFRAMKGFSPLLEKSFNKQNLDNFYQDSLGKYVNQEIFYDDAAENYTAYVPGNLEFISDSIDSAQQLVRNLIYKYLDNEEWGEVLQAEDILLDITEGRYKWKIEFNPVNWQLAE